MLGSVRTLMGTGLPIEGVLHTGLWASSVRFWGALQLQQAAAHRVKQVAAPPGFPASWDLQQLAPTAAPSLPPALP